MTSIKDRIKGEGWESPEQLLANPANWRVHPRAQRDALLGHLREVGWVQRTIVNETTGHIIDGHLRVQLAIDEGIAQVPVIYVELTEQEELVALASMDSITALATTDQDAINKLLLQVSVSDDRLLSHLNNLSRPTDASDKSGKGDPDRIPAARPEATTQKGDIWILGEHRLICGDSTEDETVGHLFDGQLADMVWTDPPYNVDYEGSDGQKIANDKMQDSHFRAFLTRMFELASAYSREGAPIYIAHADSQGLQFREAMIEGGWAMKQCLVWVKNSMVLGRQDYQWQHEPILYGWKPGAAHTWFGEFNKKTVIDDEPDIRTMDKEALLAECKRLRNSLNASIIREEKPSRNDQHPTMKPTRLIIHMLKNSSRDSAIVYDPCGGSGSTMIAAQQTSRKALLAEIDPVYCDVIVRRYQEFTGLQAVNQATGQPFNAGDS